MSVYIYQDDAFDRLCAVEGEEFREAINYTGDVSFSSNLEQWRKATKECPALVNDPKLADLCFWYRPNSIDGVIYGLGGWHRYIVTNCGEIVFLRLFCAISPHGAGSSDQHIKQARLIGFKIR